MNLYQPTITGSLKISGSVEITGSLIGSAVTASYATNLTVSGTITAQTLVVQTVTSSVIYSSGSNVFGNNIANTQVLTGSVTVTGSLAVITNGTEFQVNATGVNLGNALTDSHVISGSVRINPNGLFVSGSGLVGIGTTSPLALLDVCVLSSGARRLLVNYADSLVTIKSANDSSNGENLRVWGDNIFFYTGSAGSGGETMRLTNTGRVAIGRTSPGTALSVAGKSEAWQLALSTDTGEGAVIGSPSANVLAFGNWAGTERMRITSAGFFKASNTGTYIGATDSFHEFSSNLNNTTTFRIKATSSIFTDYLLFLHADKANNSDYSFLQARSNNTSDTEFNLRGDGNAYADGSWNGGGADYAEFFEWLDGNPNNEDRRGYSVSLVDNKIKIAENGETIIGVISGNPSVIGDSAWNIWTEKYLRDDFGTYIRDENGFKVLNPNYNPDIDYIPREERPEWGIVGLMGKLCIRKGQEVMPNWIKMQDISENVEQWLIR
jgi:hypothetical protein